MTISIALATVKSAVEKAGQKMANVVVGVGVGVSVFAWLHNATRWFIREGHV